MYDRIVLNIPHSSSVFPFGKGGWDNGIDEEIMRWTDWYTDWLFQSHDARIVSVSFPFSRFFCDVERLENDPLESVGQGVVYRSFNALKRNLSDDEELWVSRIYREHLGRLQSYIIDGRTLIVDCHSFPSDLSEIDVCIGFNDDWSCPSKKTIDTVINTFRSKGYTVGINNPYSNSITPHCPHLYKSIMIELNKSIYLDGHNTLLFNQAERLKCIINDLYLMLLCE